MPCNSNNDNPFCGRVAVKIVSIVDLLLAATLLCYYGYKWAIYDIKADQQSFANGPITVESVVRHQSIFIWIAVIIFHSMQFIMSLVLLSAAFERDAEDALGKCQMWWCTAVMLFMVLGLEMVMMIYMVVAHTGIQPVSLVVFMVKFVFRLTAVVNVRKYMKSLKNAPPTSVHQKVYIRSKTLGPPPSNYIRY